jgi:hypothetical protein
VRAREARAALASRNFSSFSDKTPGNSHVRKY